MGDDSAGVPMSDRADADFEECPECRARFPLTEVQFPEVDEDDTGDHDDDMKTQFGWLAGQCPECGNDLRLSYDRVRNLFLPPN